MFDQLRKRFGKGTRKKHEINAETADLTPPVHIGIIMDGNGRWAARRNLSRSVGHRYGGETLRKIVYAASDLGVSYITVYAFSTENWKRPQKEIDAIMDLFFDFFDRYRGELKNIDCRVRFSGRTEGLPPKVVETIRTAERESAHCRGIQLIVAFNYGGRQEILDALKKLNASRLQAGIPADEPVSEEEFSRFLYLPDVPDPDLIIRSSGEMRLSNFLLWEAAYAEFWVSDILWPDFTKEDLMQAISDYNARDRRYGGLSNGK